MMEFKKDFPSLKIHEVDRDYREMVLVSGIQEHCLDKQKVIEALQRARGLSSMSSEVMVTIRRIEKDLGLEK